MVRWNGNNLTKFHNNCEHIKTTNPKFRQKRQVALIKSQAAVDAIPNSIHLQLPPTARELLHR